MKIVYIRSAGVYAGTAHINGHYYYATGYTHAGVIARLLTLAKHV